MVTRCNLLKNQVLKKIVSELELLISLREDDFDRGKGKYILKEYIESLNKEYYEI